MRGVPGLFATSNPALGVSMIGPSGSRRGTRPNVVWLTNLFPVFVQLKQSTAKERSPGPIRKAFWNRMSNV